MKPPKCIPVPGSERYGRVALRGLHHEADRLVVDVQGEGFSFAQIVFDCPVGFRVLKECDLCEFWGAYSTRNGWLWEVKQGGWLELESKRKAFVSREVVVGLREFMLVDFDVISVLCVDPPSIVDLGADPAGDRVRR